MSGKNYIALFLLVLINVRTLVIPLVYMDFELRKAFIIKNLCENRFKPELHCNGKCYLAKKLNKIAEDNASKETNKQSQAFKKILEEVFENQSLFTFNWSHDPADKIVIFPDLKIYTNAFISSVFHPPSA